MKIREATIDDIDDMSILWRMMIQEISPDTKPSLEWWIDMQKGMMENNIYGAYVVTIEGVMIGFICGMMYPDSISQKLVGFGQDFYVMPDFREGRAPRLLYRGLMKMAKEKGAEYLEMTCFEGQLDLWQSKGFDIYKYHVRRAI